MGNRAVIQFTPNKAVYIHWNGGCDSVQAFLDVCKTLRKDKTARQKHAPQLFAAVVTEFMQHQGVVVIGNPQRMDVDNGDNGLYYVDPITLEITGRAYHHGTEDYNERNRTAVYTAALERYLKAE